MAKPRLGNTGVSALLSSSKAAYERTQSYNDSIQSYIFDESPKAEDDYAKYESYLKGRMEKTSDPSKALTLQKTITSAYRSFNSSEISRQTMAVNYGDITDTDKYNKMYGLLQRATSTGDFNLAQSIEAQMASLSVKIQNAQDAATAKASAGASKASAASLAQAKTDLNDLSNKIDLAYQTGQPLVVNGESKTLNAKDYALNRAWVIANQHQMLSQQAATDPGAADNLSQLEKGDEYRSLIGSGAVTFDDNGHPIANSNMLDSLAVTLGKDSIGNTVRKYKAVEPGVAGKPQFGLIKGANQDTGGFVTNHVLSDAPGAASGRVLYQKGYDSPANINPLKDAQGKADPNYLLKNDPLGFSGGKQTGSQLIVDPKTQLQSTLYYDKKLGRNLTTAEAKANLDNLTHPKKADDNMFSVGNIASSLGEGIKKAVGFDWKKELGNLTRPTLAPATGQTRLGHLADHGNQIKQQKEAAALAERARINAENYNASVRAQINAAAVQRAQANAIKLPAFKAPAPVLSPAKSFALNLPANSTPSQKAKALNDSGIAGIGGTNYGTILKKSGF